MLAYISARKKLIHIMSLNTNRPINRATVVACVISATSNHLKLNGSETLNPPLCNIHAETRKLWTCSAVRVAASRPDPDHQSTNCPLIHSARPPRCVRHSSWLVRMQHARRLVLASLLPSRVKPTRSSHRARCLAEAHCTLPGSLPHTHRGRLASHRAQLPDRRED
jgi:hypothetical protein